MEDAGLGLGGSNPTEQKRVEAHTERKDDHPVGKIRNLGEVVCWWVCGPWVIQRGGIIIGFCMYLARNVGSCRIVSWEEK